MDFLEVDIENLIMDTIESGNAFKLHERGLDISEYDIFFRQLDLGAYGRLDIVGFNYEHTGEQMCCAKTINVGVIEIKKDKIDVNTLMQAIRYCKGIQRLLKQFSLLAEFKIILVGTSICKSDFCFIGDFVPNLNIYTVKMDLDKGIIFQSEVGYKINGDENIKPSLSNVYDFQSYLKSKVKNSTKYKNENS